MALFPGLGYKEEETHLKLFVPTEAPRTAARDKKTSF